VAIGATGIQSLMGAKYVVGKNVPGICDRCGFRYKLRQLRKLTINSVQVDLKVCPECWEEDHPQNMQGRYPVYDPQTVRDPRPDTSDDS